jgi:hypothetical protein
VLELLTPLLLWRVNGLLAMPHEAKLPEITTAIANIGLLNFISDPRIIDIILQHNELGQTKKELDATTRYQQLA